MSLTMAEILAEMPAGDAQVHWAACPEFPAGALAPEAISILLTAASIAATKKNATLDPGQQIAAFPSPTYAGIALNPESGLETALKTVSVVTRVPISNESAVGALV